MGVSMTDEAHDFNSYTKPTQRQRATGARGAPRGVTGVQLCHVTIYTHQTHDTHKSSDVAAFLVAIGDRIRRTIYIMYAYGCVHPGTHKEQGTALAQIDVELLPGNYLLRCFRWRRLT